MLLTISMPSGSLLEQASNSYARRARLARKPRSRLNFSTPERRRPQSAFYKAPTTITIPATINALIGANPAWPR